MNAMARWMAPDVCRGVPLALDIKRAVSQDALPGERASDLFLSYAVLLLAKGERVSEEDVHNAWVAWMESKGETHEAMVPFDELSPEKRAEDAPFVLAIREVARRSTIRAQENPGPGR
jgi:hypothetical protein